MQRWAAGRKVPRWATLTYLAELFGIGLPDSLAEPERRVASRPSFRACGRHRVLSTS
jgi:hypothetical protein